MYIILDTRVKAAPLHGTQNVRLQK